MRWLAKLGIALSAALLGVGRVLGDARDGIARVVVEARAPGKGKRDKALEEDALRAKPVAPDTDTRQQRRARERAAAKARGR